MDLYGYGGSALRAIFPLEGWGELMGAWVVTGYTVRVCGVGEQCVVCECVERIFF